MSPLIPAIGRTYLGLVALKRAIPERLEQLNRRSFRKLNTSRAGLFERIERAALKPMPSEPFIFGEWKKARVSTHLYDHLQQ